MLLQGTLAPSDGLSDGPFRREVRNQFQNATFPVHFVPECLLFPSILPSVDRAVSPEALGAITAKSNTKQIHIPVQFARTRGRLYQDCIYASVTVQNARRRLPGTTETPLSAYARTVRCLALTSLRMHYVKPRTDLPVGPARMLRGALPGCARATRCPVVSWRLLIVASYLSAVRCPVLN
eukprot:1171522-Rhodomonas_salina.2